MLTLDPKKRITSAQVLEHPWIREDGEASDKPIDSAVLSRMKQFRAMNKLKKLALKVIAENLSADEIQGLKSMFMNKDTDNSGTITYEELKTGLAGFGSKLTESEVRQLMDVSPRRTFSPNSFSSIKIAWKNIGLQRNEIGPEFLPKL
ncbi:hypothetical protein LXL04_034817 [Taraxacum kok-saghyz]